MTKHLEVKTVEYKGISVMLEIDYDRGTVALIGDTMGNRKPKEWVFAGRGLEYMDPWLKIMDAMKFAVGVAKKDLEQDLAEKSAFKDEKLSAFARAMVDEPLRKKKK